MCPLPWLEEAEDVQYNFDDVFIPLRTIDIDIQQKDDDLSGPSDKKHKKLPELSSRGDLPGPSSSRNEQEQTGDLSGPSGEVGNYHQTRYNYNKFILLCNINNINNIIIIIIIPYFRHLSLYTIEDVIIKKYIHTFSIDKYITVKKMVIKIILISTIV